MSVVSTKVEAIRKAIKEMQGFANGDTWSGTPADNWMTEMNGLIKAANTCLDVAVPAAKSQALKNAQKMQVESAQKASQAGS
jgi:hypothetical protein